MTDRIVEHSVAFVALVQGVIATCGLVGEGGSSLGDLHMNKTLRPPAPIFSKASGRIREFCVRVKGLP